eukprot:TRINITY_DN58168_c0_g1_i1.p1 TRINITY_DN58168_c0_g1~~TRINITY_DN58168_c0_g1_i1.p1  ORF type:complete len:459 (-),score=80.67 TRINITY_DN58168_c0_g1_i1:63-1439(-)
MSSREHLQLLRNAPCDRDDQDLFSGDEDLGATAGSTLCARPKGRTWLLIVAAGMCCCVVGTLAMYLNRYNRSGSGLTTSQSLRSTGDSDGAQGGASEESTTAAAAAAQSAAPVSSATTSPAHIPVVATETSFASPVGKSLYCFMVILPSGYEREMVRSQYERGVSIFQCDAHAVLSSETFPLTNNTALGNQTTVSFGGDMRVSFNTWTWGAYGVKLALNTGVFIRVWKKLFELSTWRNFDWTVKCEADTVFFPQRLQKILPSLVPQSGDLGQRCGSCARFPSDTCESHVQWEQTQGLTCLAALEKISLATDCNCECGVDVCRKPYSVYLRNCPQNFLSPEQKAPNKALHGPLEVLSRGAFDIFEQGIDRCSIVLNSTFEEYGEDVFLEACMKQLHVNPVDSWDSLSDKDCDPYGQNDNSCRNFAAAYQPFKTPEAYMQCMQNALEAFPSRSDGRPSAL